jgi:hypothetical protein
LFVLLEQPIISVAGRILRGPAVEVLLRLDDEEDGLISRMNSCGQPSVIN